MTFGVSEKQKPVARDLKIVKQKLQFKKIKLMKFIYIFILFSLISTGNAQTKAVSSGVKLMPVANIPNIYADAPSVITEMQVNDQISLEASAQVPYNNNGMDAADNRPKPFTPKRNKTYPKL